MPQPPNMMGAHANNMMAQAPTQNQFLPQNQFPSSSGAMSVNNVGMGQPAAQTGVSQVPFAFGPPTLVQPQLPTDLSMSFFTGIRILDYTFDFYL